MEIINHQRQIPRMRTVKEAAAEIKQLDEHTAMTEWRIRELPLRAYFPAFRRARSC